MFLKAYLVTKDGWECAEYFNSPEQLEEYLKETGDILQSTEERQTKEVTCPLCSCLEEPENMVNVEQVEIYAINPDGSRGERLKEICQECFTGE